MTKFAEENMKSGVLIMTGGLQRPTKGPQVEQANGKFRVTDGPFAEPKQLIDGFTLINARSREEAVEHARRFMNIAGEGSGEILQVFGAGEASPARG